MKHKRKNSEPTFSGVLWDDFKEVMSALADLRDKFSSGEIYYWLKDDSENMLGTGYLYIFLGVLAFFVALAGLILTVYFHPAPVLLHLCCLTVVIPASLVYLGLRYVEFKADQWKE